MAMRLATKVQKAAIAVLNRVGPKQVECTVCGWEGYAFKSSPRRTGLPMLICSQCGSKERHRHQALAFTHWDVKHRVAGARVLHVAPEKRFRDQFADAALYVRADLNPNNTQQPIDVCTDIARASFATGSFDFVYASHVLEHIPAVEEALAELFRVLVPGGYAFLDVPTYGLTTVRLPAPDHDGHIWHPGREDWFDRYEQAGFQVDYFPSTGLDPRFGIGDRTPITLCIRP